MNAESINRWMGLAANVGVLVGIVFLIVEINQNSELMRVQIAQSRSDAIQENLMATVNSDYVLPIYMKVGDGEPLTPEEYYRILLTFRSNHTQQANTFYQLNQGMLDESALSSIEDFVREFGELPVARDIWNQIQNSYSPEYQTFVNGILVQE